MWMADGGLTIVFSDQTQLDLSRRDSLWGHTHRVAWEHTYTRAYLALPAFLAALLASFSWSIFAVSMGLALKAR